MQEELHTLRLKLKAARAVLRDLTVAVAQVEEILQDAANAQPKEAKRDEHNHRDRDRELARVP